jgi:dolichol-phosphate mannosyltransferase
LLSVILPVYNEKENIRGIIESIFRVLRGAHLDAELIVVDDSSPDGTADLARRMTGEYHDLRVIVRAGERGAASAVLRGFEAAKGDIVLAMDADFSHPPELIPMLVQPLQEGKAEIAVASRYVKGGSVGDWPFKLRAISKGATALGRLVTRVKDPMSGYFALKQSVIEGVKLKTRSCKILLEILAKGNYSNVVEVPFTFKDRKSGESKTENRRMKDYLVHLMTLLFAKNSRLLRFVKFCTVGAIGAVINLAILYSLTEWSRVWYIISAAVAAGVAVTSNYILNKVWTFRFAAAGKAVVVFSYTKFIAVSVFGMGLNLTLLYLLVDRLHIWYIFSQIIAISAVAVWNYFGSATWAFKR